MKETLCRKRIGYVSEAMLKITAASYWLEEDEFSFAPARGFREGRNPIFLIRIVLLLWEDEISGGG